MKYSLSIFQIAGMIIVGVLMFTYGGILPVITWILILIIVPILFKKLGEKTGLVPKSHGFYDSKSGRPLSEKEFQKKMKEGAELFEEILEDDDKDETK